MKYLFLNSEDSKDFHTNTNTEFTIELPDAIEGKFVCALSEIKFENTPAEDLCVYCDIIEDSYINNSFLPLLRIVTESTKFHNLYYFRVKQARIPRIKISIKTRAGATPTLTGNTTCTLALKHVDKSV